MASITIASNDPDESQKTISITAVPHKCAVLEMPGIWMDMQPNCSCATGSVTLNNVPQNEIYSILNTTTNKVIEGSGGFVATIDELIPGTYSFVIIDKWGCKSPESPKVVNRDQPVTPATPHIERSGNVLFSSSQPGNQWYNQDGPIQGATSQQFEVKKSGSHYVVVTSDYCYSDPSSTVSVDYLNGDKIIFSDRIRWIPNPATAMFKLKGLKNKACLKVFDLNGRIVLAKDVENDEWISFCYLPSGIYLVQIVDESNVMTKKLVKKMSGPRIQLQVN